MVFSLQPECVTNTRAGSAFASSGFMLSKYLSYVLMDVFIAVFLNNKYINLHRLITEHVFILKNKLISVIFQLDLKSCKKCGMPLKDSFSLVAQSVSSL